MNLFGKYNQSYIDAKEKLAQLGKKTTTSTNNDLPPGQVITTQFPVLDLGLRPEIPKSEWKIRICGEVENPETISYEKLLTFPKIDISRDFHCVTRWSKRDVQWSGVQFKYIAERAIMKETAKFIIQEGYDDYTTNLPLDVLLADDVILAYKLFGEDIPKEHGGLVRIIIPSRYGWKGSKFLSGIMFVSRDEPGFWETRGYNNNADYLKEERYGV